MLSPATLRVRCGLRGVYVKACVKIRPCLAAFVECPVAERKRRMHPKQSAQPVIACILAVLKKRAILLDALMRHFRAVAVGDLVAKATAHAGLARGLGNAEQTARHSAGAGMMVKYCCHAVADRGDHAHHGAPVNVVEHKRLVEPPPQPLQNLSEVTRRVVFHRHTASEGAIEMRVRVDEAGHDLSLIHI